jgi:hypothetical protein
MRWLVAAGAARLVAVLAALWAATPDPPASATVRRVATQTAAEQAWPTATPYPTPAVVPTLARTRAAVLVGAADGWGTGRVERVDAKLMRLGDWWRLQDGSSHAGDDPASWVWVVAWWGDDFEPFGTRLLGVRYTWAAHAGSARDGDHSESSLRAVRPPVWDDLPDYSAAARP